MDRVLDERTYSSLFLFLSFSLRSDDTFSPSDQFSLHQLILSRDDRWSMKLIDSYVLWFVIVYLFTLFLHLSVSHWDILNQQLPVTFASPWDQLKWCIKVDSDTTRSQYEIDFTINIDIQREEKAKHSA